ncbi:hypothetical protein KKG05_06185, partial [bacterium]|nr:hypothetical protein [bacterium]
DVFYADCWTFFNHSNFYRFDFSMLKDIDQRLCKWFESLTTPEDIQAFLSGLLSLKYTKEQREQMGLHTPSERLLSLAVLRMSIKDDEVTKQVNNLVIALLRSYNNPLDFPESGLIDAKLVELIKSTVVKEGFSIPLAQTTDLIVRIPRALDSENAVEIAKLIIANYPKSDNEDYEIAMLLTLLKCIDSSPGANTTAADNKFVEEAKNLSATTQKMLLSEIETIWGDRSDKVGILKQKVINQTWAWVKENIDKPDDELFLSVDICRNYQEIVPEDEIKDFFRKTLLLTDASKVHTYSEFIVKRILQYAGDFVAECAHAIEGNIGNTDIDGGCREEYLLVLIKLLLQTSEDIKDEMFLKLTNRLLDGDKVLLSLIPNHYVELCEATGDSITRDFAESLFNRILEDEEGELDIYSALYKQILSGFELKAEQSSRLAKRI